MKRKYIVFVVVVLFSSVLMGCTDKQKQKPNDKTPYNIETINYNDLGSKAYIQKSGKILPGEDITTSSKVPGKVRSIQVKEGDYVSQGQVLVRLTDNVNDLDLSLDQAQSRLQNAKYQYEQTERELNNSLQNAENSLQQAQSDYETVKETTEQNLRQVRQNYEDSNFSDVKSQAQKEYEKTKKEYENAKQDYQNMLEENQEQINGFKDSYEVHQTNLRHLYDNVLEQADRLLGMDEYDNDDFESYLAAKKSSLKSQAEKRYNELNKVYNNFLDEDVNDYSDEQLLDKIISLDSKFNDIEKYIKQLDEMLVKSVSSSSFTEKDIETYRTTLQNLKGQQWSSSYGNFTSFKSSAESFLKIYEQKESSQQRQIDIMEDNIEILESKLKSGEISADTALKQAEKNAENSIRQAEIRLENARNQYETIKQNKQVTLNSLEQSIKQAEIGQSQVQRQANRLVVTSPIDGQIDEVMIDQGQEINAGEPIVTIVGGQDQHINIGLTASDLEYVNIGKQVQIEHKNSVLTGTVSSISNMGDQNLNYNVKITLNQNVSLYGNTVMVRIPVYLDSKLIDLDYVQAGGQGNKGSVYILSGENQLNRKNLEVGNLFGSKIEILTGLNMEDKIITTSLDNYNENRFYLNPVD